MSPSVRGVNLSLVSMRVLFISEKMGSVSNGVSGRIRRGSHVMDDVGLSFATISRWR
jgi:hypothetical protein